MFVQSFESEPEVWEFLGKENCWSKYYKTKSDEGDRQILRCNKVEYRATAQCAARAYYLCDSKSTKVHLFRAADDHDHENNINLVYEIPHDTKEAIKKMFNYGVTKPKRILNNLTVEKIELPERKKFDAFLKQLRDEKFGAGSINMAELKQWLEENSAIPEEKTKPFIADYVVNFNEADPYFRFFVTSKQLLSLAVNVRMNSTDGTYKMNWQGYPVLQIGATDKHRSYHKFGIAVCTNERASDYEFIFAAVKNAVKTIFKIDIMVDVLISDAAKSIHNGFEKVHGKPIVFVMCWAHMRRNIVEKLPTYIRDQKKRFEFLFDLDKLQISQTDNIFDRAANLFVEKWEKVNAKFMEYFVSEWLNKNRYWYEGVRHFTPSTNNALETDNRVMKDEHTLRERYDVAKFRAVLFTMIETCSLAYVNGTKEFHTNPIIDLELWTNTYVWAKKDIPMTVHEYTRHIMYTIPADSAQVDESSEWTTFDEFKLKNFQICHVNFPNPFTKNNWHEGICDCSDFFKKFMCIHVLGISLRMKFVIAPDEAKALPLGQKRKRGRPALAKAALILQ